MGLSSINVARVLYVLICELAGVLIALSTKDNVDFVIPVWAGLSGGLIVALIGILLERMMKEFTLRGFSTATFGILVGLLCAWLLTRVGIDDLITQGFGFNQDTADAVQLIANVTLFGSLSFFGASLALRSSREDFAFIIPYVRFRSESLGGRPVLLDSEALIDGRVIDLLQTGFLTTNLAVPDFVLEDLRTRVEEEGKARSNDGEKALAILSELKSLQNVELRVHDTRHLDSRGERTEERVIRVAQLLGARLLTTHVELAQLARVQSVEVLHLPDLIKALQPRIGVGETFDLALVRPGKDDQAIGYLPSGMMVVVNHGVEAVGETRAVTVISTLETGSGTMIFAEIAR